MTTGLASEHKITKAVRNKLCINSIWEMEIKLSEQNTKTQKEEQTTQLRVTVGAKDVVLVEQLVICFEGVEMRSSHCKIKTLKKANALVVGRFGCGKSTFLNALAGVHWKIEDGKFVNISVGKGQTDEIFPSSMSAKGVTTTAVARTIDTFIGGELTVIDTVGYDDSINAEKFYTKSNLTEVMDQFHEISSVVIVVNSKDPRLSNGFVEALACVPRSFKKEIQKNVVFVFTNWHVDDEDTLPDNGNRLEEQIRIMRAALGIGDDINIPEFWMDNRPFKKRNENAAHTISALKSFLAHVATMPGLSCQEFKEMRALTQFGRAVRMTIKDYFNPSKQDPNKQDRKPSGLSGFETFLFEKIDAHSDKIQKQFLLQCTAKQWSEKLTSALAKDIHEELPMIINNICEEVAVDLGVADILDRLQIQETAGGTGAKALINIGTSVCVALAFETAGLSLLCMPLVWGVAKLHSRMWKRAEVGQKVAFDVSAQYGENLCSEITNQFTTHLDKVALDLQAYFEDPVE
eukprot:CAMPEP_0172317364 /NCGR_PEP_ID=MMETSP1058-20130122/31363_1 /TAXON_ID=83371 /ORGANISM="Detonula confervacea, Strain CCMP 353" /LENGTH=517 /DNA_ID=CAMNT_0013031903 /DNA_START=430 /DNA_END=1983 /DNA_ORIENTATION=-